MNILVFNSIDLLVIRYKFVCESVCVCNCVWNEMVCVYVCVCKRESVCLCGDGSVYVCEFSYVRDYVRVYC